MPPSTPPAEDPEDRATIRDAAALVPVPVEAPPLFGRYRPVRELGRGGMGVVLLAHDTVLDVQVALKLVPETVVRDTEGIVDLKKEVLRGMELTHPGIVRVFSFEQDATAAIIVMEHIEGETLGQKKARQPGRCFDCEEVRPWLEQLCKIIDYAHGEARIAHRDLKPGNLMLTSAGRLKVGDFGIAASLSETMSRVSVRSDSSGTPPYMSPQQAMGARPTHLDDIYSIGATFYDLLTGKPPFFRGNIVAQLMQEEPATMTARREELGVTDRAPIPPAWEKMVAACLAKAPESRPASGAEILAMLTNPGRALAVEFVADAAPIQRVYPRPAAPGKSPLAGYLPRAEKKPPVRILQPLVGAIAAAIRGIIEALGAVLGPLLKIAAVIAVLWGLLQLKPWWETRQANREAAEARKAAAERAEAAPEGARLQPAILDRRPPRFTERRPILPGNRDRLGQTPPPRR